MMERDLLVILQQTNRSQRNKLLRGGSVQASREPCIHDMPGTFADMSGNTTIGRVSYDDRSTQLFHYKLRIFGPQAPSSARLI